MFTKHRYSLDVVHGLNLSGLAAVIYYKLHIRSASIASSYHASPITGTSSHMSS